MANSDDEIISGYKKNIREKILPLMKMSIYTAKILPVHCKQMKHVVESTEQAILSLGDSFNEIVDKLYSDDLVNDDAPQINVAKIHEKIDEILFSLQFQDATRQIMEHVQSDLLKISGELLEANKVIRDEFGGFEVETSGVDCLATYTTSKERENYHGIESTSVENDTDDDQITYL